MENPAQKHKILPENEIFTWSVWTLGYPRQVFRATVNQHPPAHHERWMITGRQNSFLLGFSSLANHGG
jgi:hypothetical protein